MLIRIVFSIVAAGLLSGGPGHADGMPVLKDAERYGPVGIGDRYPSARRVPGPDRRDGLPRRVTGGPGYVGSDWGLGKPSFSGIGTRPDWGRTFGE